MDERFLYIDGSISVVCAIPYIGHPASLYGHLEDAGIVRVRPQLEVPYLEVGGDLPEIYLVGLGAAVYTENLGRLALQGQVVSVVQLQLLNVLASLHACYHTEEGRAVLRSLDEALGFAEVLDQFTLRQLARTVLSLREHFSGQGFSMQDMRERREASRALSDAQIERAISMVDDLETSGLIPLLNACCI